MTAPDEGPDLDAVLTAVADAVGRGPDELSGATRLVEVCADSLDLYCLYVTLDTWVPGFLLPRQLDFDVVTLADVHHYLLVRREQRRR